PPLPPHTTTTRAEGRGVGFHVLIAQPITTTAFRSPGPPVFASNSPHSTSNAGATADAGQMRSSEPVMPGALVGDGAVVRAATAASAARWSSSPALMRTIEYARFPTISTGSRAIATR